MTDHADRGADYSPGTVANVEGRIAVLIGKKDGPRRWQWMNGDWTANPLGDIDALGHVAALDGYAAIAALKRELATSKEPVGRRILCRIIGHRFAGWTAAGARPGEPLPYARCARCGRIL